MAAESNDHRVRSLRDSAAALRAAGEDALARAVEGRLAHVLRGRRSADEPVRLALRARQLAQSRQLCETRIQDREREAAARQSDP